MRVLVTGGAGFIGSHCVDALLSQGNHVTVVDNFSSGREANLVHARALASTSKLELRVEKASIDDPELWERLGHHDALFHLAAQTSVTRAVRDPEVDFATNAAPIPLILSWLRRSRTRMVVYANTAGALYGDPLTYPTDERSLVQPVSPYGATKSFFETYLASTCRSLKASGVWTSDPRSTEYFSWVSLRLSNVYGPRQVSTGESGVVPIFFQSIANGKSPTIFGDGNKTRDYVHVRDVAQAFVSALTRMREASFDEAFNVGTGIETSDVDVFEYVLKAARDLSVSDRYASLLAKSAVVTRPEFAPVRPGEVIRSVLNVAKIDAFLGWLAPTKFEQGVRETVESYCAELTR